MHLSPQIRKAATEARLQKEGIPINPSLPWIESEAEAELRTAEELGIRIACLFCVVGWSFEPGDTVFRDYLKENNLWDHLTPDEVTFLSSTAPARQTIINFTWRCEALFILMWAVRLFEELPLPREQVDNSEIISRFPDVDSSPWPFIRNLQIRSTREVLDASDLIYRLHWATREAELKEASPPAGLIPGVIKEWHHAINWITKYGDEGWDDVSTDT